MPATTFNPLSGKFDLVTVAEDLTPTLDSRYLKLDQTSSQTIVNGQPIFDTLTASQLVATDASKKLQSLTTATYPSLTELSYVKGVTSAIQTQLNAKLDSATAATTYLKLDASNDPVTGDLLVKPSTDSATGFAIQDKDANGVLTVDTVNNSVGIGIAPTATSKLYVNRDSTENTGSIYAQLVRNTVAHTANSNGTYYGLSFGVRDTAGSTYNITGALRGMEGYAYKYGNSVLTTVTAFEGQTGILQANATGSITTARGMRLTALNLSSSGATIGTNTGIEITNDVAGTSTEYNGLRITDATTSTATTKYGIYIGAITKGGANYGIYSLAKILAKGAAGYSTPVFTGTGLNDFATAGLYSGGATTAVTVTIVVDSVGATDTFKWKMGFMDYVTGVAMTGANQFLREGVFVKFTAKTGHTLNDQWTFTYIGYSTFVQQNSQNTTTVSQIGANGNLGIGQGVQDGIRVGINGDFASEYYDPQGFYYYGAAYSVNANPGANCVSGHRVYGMQANVSKYGTYASGTVVGARFNTAIIGGSAVQVSSGQFLAQGLTADTTSTTVYAGEFSIQKYTAGTTWTITNAYIIRASYDVSAGSFAITNQYGLYLPDINLGSSIKQALTTNAGLVTFNEGGDPNTDVRMESDTEVNMFLLDANADTDGAIYLGGTTNGVKILKGGEMTFEGTATVWDDVVVNLSNIKAPASDPPTWRTYKGCELPAFGAGGTNALYFTCQIPHGYKEGSNIGFHIHVAYPNANAGNSRWTFTYAWANVDGNFPAAATSETLTFASPASTDRHSLHAFTDITGTNKTISSVLLCSISRIGGDAADTYGSDIYAISADFHVEKNSVGSKTATAK